MKVSAFIRKSARKNDVNALAAVYIRLRDAKIDLRVASELEINPNHWCSVRQGYKDRIALVSDNNKHEFNNSITSIKDKIRKSYSRGCDVEWLKMTIEEYHHQDRFPVEDSVKVEQQRIFSVHELFQQYLEKHKMSEVRKKNFRVIGRAMQRYELYVRATKRGQKSYEMFVDEVSSDTLRDMWDFFKNEYRYFEEYPQIYQTIPEFRTPQKRGHNTLSEIFTRIRTFFLWCNSNKRTTNRPFDDFRIEECRYGTPIYITVDERNEIFKIDLSKDPELAVQRDIFVFQCLIGCRVGDLMKMTKDNVINGVVEYIPRKTKYGRPVTLQVPLSPKAKEIVERYKDTDSMQLLPFTYEQKYNESIKLIFKAAGLDRKVTVINPTTSEEEKRPLYEVATSHMARRTFVGNLYKKVKDPNLVSALSGHKEGSKAFARYRDISMDDKIELVDMVD